MSSIQANQYYIQLWQFIEGPAIKVMQHFFEVKILNNSKFESFLNDENNKHILFHQLFPRAPCCNCTAGSLAAPMNRRCLHSKQFEMLYDKSGLPQPGHDHLKGSRNIQFCLCKYSAKCSIKVTDLDFHTFCHIIQYCCSSKMNCIWLVWLESIKDIRNYLARGPSQVTKQLFQEYWKTLETATLGFACEIGEECEKMFRAEISRIQYSSKDPQEMFMMLEKQHEDFIALRNELKAHNMSQTIGEKLEEIEKAFELMIKRQLQQEPQDDKFVAMDADESMLIQNLKLELTDEEKYGLREATSSTLSTYGKINEEYLAKKTERDECIGGVDENARTNSSKSGHDMHDNKKRKFIQECSDSMEKEDPESKQKLLKQDFKNRIHARSRSSSLSQLHLSILEDNDIEKDWFYKLNITCDNYCLHLINDVNIPRKFKALSKTIKSKGQTKLTTEHRTNEDSITAFERIYQQIICSNNLPMSDCIKLNLDLVVRFHLTRHIAPTELVKFLYESLKDNRNAISKAIGWNVTRQFCKDIPTKVVNSFIDIWPGFRCLCEKHCRKDHSRICSTEPVIVVEVDLFSNAIPDALYGIPIQQSYPEVKAEHRKDQCLEERTDVSSFMDNIIQTPVTISGEIAEMLFKQHSKMTMIHVHPFRRTSIQLWCQIKGIIPMGEKHFPKMINGIETCIAEGHVRFMAKIKIGDTIGVSGSAGTLGGFVQMHGYNAFLTCAHVVHNKNGLIAGNKRELHKSKTKVFCQDRCNPNSNIESGYVFNEAFDFNNAGGTSVDAAVVILDEEKVSFDEKDILNKRSSAPVSADFLGMKSLYLNDSYITPKAVSGTVTARYVGVTSGYVESDVSFKDYDEDYDNFKTEPNGLCLYFKDLPAHLQDIESECPKPAETPFEVHFQQLMASKLEERIKSGRHFFRCYKQLLFTDFSFEPGDSGTCIYVVEDKTIIRPDNQPNPTGCLAMAIASFYDSNENRNKCIATPMHAILKRLGLI